MYLVIECCEREISQVRPAADTAAAAALANELLEKYLSEIGADASPSGEWPPETQRADPAAGEYSAWSNAKGKHYDAHCFGLPDDVSSPIAAALLKSMCKARMDADDSDCGDGTCDDCHINGVLSMLGNR